VILNEPVEVPATHGIPENAAESESPEESVTVEVPDEVSQSSENDTDPLLISVPETVPVPDTVLGPVKE
jgi:hypothetical protein